MGARVGGGGARFPNDTEIRGLGETVRHLTTLKNKNSYDAAFYQHIFTQSISEFFREGFFSCSPETEVEGLDYYSGRQRLLLVQTLLQEGGEGQRRLC